MKRFWACVSLVLVTSCSGGGSGESVTPQETPPPPPPPTGTVEQCRNTLSSNMQQCLSSVSAGLDDCYAGGGGLACSTNPQTRVTTALSDLTSAVSAQCGASDLSTLGLPSGAGLTRTLEDQCLRPLTTLAARSFGGPQGRASADSPGDICLTTAFDEAATFLERSAEIFATCAAAENCTNASADINPLEASSRTAIASACPSDRLREAVGLTPERFMDRTRTDAECQAATLYPPEVIGVACTPRTTVDAVQVFEYPNDTPRRVFSNQSTDGTPSQITAHGIERGQYVQIELDAEETGAKCGNQSNYRFWLQPAPAGQRLDRILVRAPGGGACTNVDSEDCAGPVAGALGLIDDAALLNTRSDGLGAAAGGATLANTLDDKNPYKDYSKIVFSYCTQDIYIGGKDGAQDVTVSLDGTPVDFTIQRTGGHNIRVASQYARDVIIGMMAAEGDTYDPAAVEAVITGSSAGGFGTTVSYHNFLDDLGWVQSSLVHQWGLGLDNSDASSENAGMLVTTFRDLWNIPEILAPYCQEADCIQFEFATERQFERLDASISTRQRITAISAQIDPTQTTSQRFETPDGSPDFVAWGNALRATYCNMRDAAFQGGYTGELHFLLPATQAHFINPNARFNDLPTIFEFVTDLEADFVVADAVDDSTNVINGRTLEPFGCSVL